MMPVRGKEKTPFPSRWCQDCSDCDSAEKPYECFDEAQHERIISNDFKCSSVRPEALEG